MSVLSSWFINPFLHTWKEIINFRGRTSRKDIWMGQITNNIPSFFLLKYVDNIVEFLQFTWLQWLFTTAFVIYIFGLLLAYTSMYFRRIRDAGRSWKFGLILLFALFLSPRIPSIGPAIAALVAIYYLLQMCQPTRVSSKVDQG